MFPTRLAQAKEQFEGQNKLSQQALEARQQAIDATLVPLREQLVKHEQLAKELGEKREGDAKSLGEQLKQIAELQQKASSAAWSAARRTHRRCAATCSRSQRATMRRRSAGASRSRCSSCRSRAA